MTHLKKTSWTIAFFVVAFFLQACSSNNNSASEPAVAAASPELIVSVKDLYWGTRDIGVETTQYVTLSNQGSTDIRINSVSMTGVNADEFSSSINSAITISAGESVELAVSFAPLSEGRKYASLDIDYDQI